MWPTLQAIKELGGSANINEITNKVVEILDIPEEVQNLPHETDRRTKLEYRLAWARTYLKKGGALDNSTRGVWTITDRGEKLADNEIPEIVAQIRLGGGKINKAREPAQEQQPLFGPEDGNSSNDDDADSGGGWKSELIRALLNIQPDAFERLTQRILRESGFKTVKVTGRSGDGGIDGTGILQMNLITFPIAFQCKRYKGSVGSPEIRDFRGAIMGKCEKGLLITTGGFTSEARREATRDGALAIDLVDGDRLCDLLKELRLGVKTETIETVTIEEDWFGQI